MTSNEAGARYKIDSKLKDIPTSDISIYTIEAAVRSEVDNPDNNLSTTSYYRLRNYFKDKYIIPPEPILDIDKDIQTYMSIIESTAFDTKGSIPIEAIYSSGKDKGMKEIDIDILIKRLENRGDLYRPKVHYIALVKHEP